MLLGLDFDNTIIKYDELFYKVAREKNLIPKEFSMDKTLIRDYLRKRNLEDEWTLMQGQVYGPRINEAIPFNSMFKTINDLKASGIEIRLISHKTKIPYMGMPFDMHEAAMNWLEQQGFFDQNKLNWKTNHVFFEETKAKKINRIITLGCTHYLDDLPEILNELPKKITKILFDPSDSKVVNTEILAIDSWSKLRSFIK